MQFERAKYAKKPTPKGGPFRQSAPTIFIVKFFAGIARFLI